MKILQIFALTILVSAGINAQTTNPCDAPTYKQFDFWVGEWNVFNGDTQVGVNNIQKILGGCVLLENWKDAKGREGKSVNTYNLQKGRWQQTWVDDSGNVLEFVGVLVKEGVMEFRAESLAKTGEKVQHRMTFTKLSDNRLRQLLEQSRDNGTTWKSGFDGAYQRRQ